MNTKLFRWAALVAVTLLPISAAAASLTTTFASNNVQDGNMFDIVIGGSDITINSFDLNIQSNGTTNVEFYLRAGGIGSSQNTAADWTRISTGSVAANGVNNATPFDVTDTTLSAGTTYGVYLTTTDGTNLAYTDGSSFGSVYSSNSDLSILEGYGKSYPFGLNFAPRVWNGSINYTVGNMTPVPLPASGLLLLGGLAFAGAGLRRRKRKS
ncbi:hypothetical protein ACOXXX_19530 [Thalassococcus sp. BH17M4-6]|uniref:hypothetical protein n=1 Tax=Thalassococcus sp. BH17M4-6 TaxID=3413148 RepID=UPI003BC64549